MIFRLSENRITDLLFTGFMLVLAIVTFENLTEYAFWDGWDDWAVMADLEIMAQDPSHMFASGKNHKDVRPPVDVVFLLGYYFWQDDPVGFRLLQIGLHLFASLLMAYTLKCLKVDLELSLLAALLFLVNTAHFRALHWVTPINYILAFIFAQILVICYNQFLNGRGRPWLGGSLLVLALAIFSHPCAITAALFCVYLTYQKKGFIKQTLATALPLLLAIPAFIFLAYIVSPTSSQNEGVIADPSLGHLFQNPFWYLGRLVTSAHWIFHEATINHFQTWEIGVGMVAFAGFAFLCHRQVFPAAGGAVWVIFSILPFLNNASERLAVGPSRHLYFASAGSSLIVAWGLRALVQRLAGGFGRRAKQGVFLCALLLLVLSSIFALKRAEALSIYFAARGYAYKSGLEPQYRPMAPRLFEKALAHAPDLVPPDIYLRMIQAGLGFGKSYQEQLEKALAKYPDDPQLIMLRGVIAFLQEGSQAQDRGDRYIQQALEMTSDRGKLKQDAAVALRNLAGYFHRSNNLERAVDLYRRTLRLQPHYVGVLTHLGNALYRQGKTEESIQTLRKAVQLDPTSGPVLQNLGNILLMVNQTEEAIRLYQSAIQVSPQNNALHFNLALAFRRQGQIAEAVSSMEQALRLSTEDVEGHLVLGQLYEKLQQYEDAIEAYKRALALQPNHAEAHSRLALLKQYHE